MQFIQKTVSSKHTKGALGGWETNCRPFPTLGSPEHQEAGGTKAKCRKFFNPAKDQADRHTDLLPLRIQNRLPHTDATTILLLRAPSWALQTRPA